MKDDFYIGWSGKTPESYFKKARLFFVASLTGILLVGVIYVTNQKGFIKSIFDYGESRKMSGYLVRYPMWGIRIKEDGEIKTIPLVGFGKKGSMETLSKIIADHSLQDGMKVTLRGTVFHYQGKYWMELTEQENSFVSSGDQMMLNRNIEMGSYMELEGEIVDPKCFFGVMNPATKAVHRSCAIRCISGGVPPLFAIRKDGQFVDYYFLHGENMESIDKDILGYVGIPVKIYGQIATYDDWKSIIIDPSDLEITMIGALPSPLAYTMCN